MHSKTHLPTKKNQSGENIMKLCNSPMNLFLFGFLILLLTHGYCKSDIHIGHSLRISVPVEYILGFIGRAFVIGTDHIELNFRAALSVEAIEGRYSCSLEVFFGDVKVWNSGHYSRFYVSDSCVLELTDEGDLQLKGSNGRVGWRTGTSGQGVERLQILGGGNLVLVDALNGIKWQSFNFPTDVMLRGQRLDVSTQLTSFPANSSSFYSFEVQHNKISLYLNSAGKVKYSYWEFMPTENRNINFVQLGPKGLELLNDKHHKIAQISSSHGIQPLRFLALDNKTGNLALYFYSPIKQKFETSYQALNTTCSLPLACRPYGICTFSNSCSCMQIQTKKHEVGSDCSEGISKGFCDGGGEVKESKMLELNGVTSILGDAPKVSNISKESCARLCIDDCKCLSALYSSGECFLYEVVMGVKQLGRENRLSYMVKVPKGIHVSNGKSIVKKWVLVLVGVVDSLIIVLVVAVLAYYLIRKRRSDSTSIDNNS